MLKSRAAMAFCGVILAVLFSAPLVVVAFSHAQDQNKVNMCANNLSQLWKMENIYMSQFGGRLKIMPTETGTAFWLKVTKTNPPLIDKANADIFQCPVQNKDEGWGTCDYRGPAKGVSTLSDNDPVGADIDGNHGMGKGGNVLTKSANVTTVSESDILWKLAALKTAVGTTAEMPKTVIAPQDMESRVKTLEIEVRKLKLMLLLNFCADSSGGWINRDHFAFLGIKYEFLKKETSETFGLSDGEGVKVTLVNPDTPASRAGAEVGDVALHANGAPLKNSKIYMSGKGVGLSADQGFVLADYVLHCLPGDIIELEVVRKGEKKVLRVETTCKTCGNNCPFFSPLSGK